jgi:hypothetical protein
MLGQPIQRVARSTASQRSLKLVQCSQSLRRLATESTLTTAVKENGSTAIAAPKPAPVPAPVKIKKGSSLADRLWAFFVGVGVGGIAFYYKLSEDITESTAEVTCSGWAGVVTNFEAIVCCTVARVSMSHVAVL